MLLLLFLAVLGYAIADGLNVDCGCFGAGDPGPAAPRTAFVRDAVLIAGLAVAWRLHPRESV